MLSVEQRTTMFLSAAFLCFSLPLCISLLLRVWKERRQLHPLQLSMAWLLMADVAMFLNYVPSDGTSLITNNFDDGTWCQISGFVSLVCVCFSNVASCMNALVIHRSLSLKSKQFSRFFKEKYGALTVLLLLPCILFATLLQQTGQVGMYRGLYCCMRDFKAVPVFTTMTVFLSAALFQFYHYYSSYAYVKKQMNATLPSNRHSSASRNPRSERGQHPERDRFVNGIRQHALRMSFVFYFAWTPMMLCGLLSYAHGPPILLETGKLQYAYPLGLDMFAVWCVKLVPLLDCLQMSRSLNKSSGKQTAGDQNCEGERMGRAKTLSSTPAKHAVGRKTTEAISSLPHGDTAQSTQHTEDMRAAHTIHDSVATVGSNTSQTSNQMAQVNIEFTVDDPGDEDLIVDAAKVPLDVQDTANSSAEHSLIEPPSLEPSPAVPYRTLSSPSPPEPQGYTPSSRTTASLPVDPACPLPGQLESDMPSLELSQSSRGTSPNGPVYSAVPLSADPSLQSLSLTLERMSQQHRLSKLAVEQLDDEDDLEEQQVV